MKALGVKQRTLSIMRIHLYHYPFMFSHIMMIVKDKIMPELISTWESPSFVTSTPSFCSSSRSSAKTWLRKYPLCQSCLSKWMRYIFSYTERNSNNYVGQRNKSSSLETAKGICHVNPPNSSSNCKQNVSVSIKCLHILHLCLILIFAVIKQELSR